MSIKESVLRAIITFAVTFGILMLLLQMIDRIFKLKGLTLLALIGAGYLAYLVYGKSEGRRF